MSRWLVLWYDGNQNRATLVIDRGGLMPFGNLEGGPVGEAILAAEQARWDKLGDDGDGQPGEFMCHGAVELPDNWDGMTCVDDFEYKYQEVTVP